VAFLDDGARVAALRRLGILDQPPAPDLDALTRLAAFVTGAPVGIINLLDADRQWQASVHGAERGVFRREDSMCQHTVATGQTVNVADATLDARFADNPFVTGQLDTIRQYCGVPLKDVEGYAVGSLCVIGPEPRSLTAEQVAALEDLAGQVECLFQLRRQHAQLVDVLEQVNHYATHDALTGLPNRRLLVDRLDQAMARAARTGQEPTVFYCDLDKFKSINDTHGHEAGDAVLKHVADRMLASVRPADTVTRLGGDEFVLLCEDLPAPQRHLVAERIRAAVGEPLQLGEVVLQVGVSIGAVQATAAQDPADLIGAADRAMYADKEPKGAPQQ
jgi:diguanylate cyclase (GGDEF)-like protein